MLMIFLIGNLDGSIMIFSPHVKIIDPNPHSCTLFTFWK